MRPHAGGLELVKWAGFAAMVADHIDLILCGRGVPWLHELGRFAFPAFAVALGMGLGMSERPGRGGAAILLPAVLAQAAWWAAEQPFRVNILFTFAACSAIAAAFAARANVIGSVAALAFVVGAGQWEGGPAAGLLVLAGFLLVRARWGGALALPVLAAPWLWFAPSAGLVAGLLAPPLARHLPFAVARQPGVLLWAYPLHLALLAVARQLAAG